ncbi:MAG TPA: undecaprenyl-diphosphate phosphatase [Bryobacteraceae bacterium]|nr:undecaprenyl-diphosphate phosphatase [Bryobacteraceae bacterium]
MSLIHVIILAVVQGLAELLPVSSSAHVVVAEKLLGLDPSAPAMTLLLVMLHTGTMFAVIVYFWRQWRDTYFRNSETFKRYAWLLIIATVITGVIGEILIKLIEKTAFRGQPKAEVEQLFSHLELIAPALAAAGVLILIAGLYERRRANLNVNLQDVDRLTTQKAGLIGVIQGLCLPFRGFSRSGATISTGILAGIPKLRAEEFSFALAVILTPFVVGREALRLIKAEHIQTAGALRGAFTPSLLGALFAFIAGLLALKWLSVWLEKGQWYLFGIYCLLAAAGIAALHHIGY